jgi:phage gp29-like protein
MAKSARAKARNTASKADRLLPTTVGRPRKPQPEKPNKRLLTEEIAPPEFTGVRTLWREAVSPGLTPQRLAAILHGGETGSHLDFLTLAEEMEERDTHYRAVLDTRKRAIGAIQPVVTAAGENARAVAIANAVEELVATPQFKMMVQHLADAVGKGYAVSEIMWEPTSDVWQPYDYRPRDQRFFTFDMVDRTTLRLITMEEPAFGVPLEPAKFICHLPRLKSGIPIRAGLAKPVSWAYLFKSYTLKDWVAFAEIYGIPFRIGKYGPMATAEDRRALLAAVRNLGSDAAAIFPSTMELELVDGAGKGGGARGVFDSLADYLDKQVSKVVLGQTMTTDHGSSMAQAKVHEEVRHDIKEWDGDQLEITINRDLVRVFVDFNFGRQKKYPWVGFPVPKPEDLTVLADTLTKVVPLGVRVRESEVRERLGFSEPDDDEAILSATGLAKFDREQHLDAPEARAEEEPDEAEEPAGEAEADADEEDKAENRRKQKKPAKARGKRAKRAAKAPKAKAENRSHKGPRDALDDLRDEALKGWAPALKPVVQPILDAARRATSYEEFVSSLPLALARMDSSKLEASLAIATSIARGLGDISTTAHK